MSSLHPLLLLFWSCCSHAHSIITTQQYATVCCPPTHSVYYVLPFYLLLSRSLSLISSPSLLYLPLAAFPEFRHPDLQLGGEREREKGRAREREEVTCISGVGTVCKLPCKLKSRNIH